MKNAQRQFNPMEDLLKFVHSIKKLSGVILFKVTSSVT